MSKSKSENVEKLRKKLNQLLFQRSITQLMDGVQEFTKIKKEGMVLLISFLLFLAGILFNLTANIIYDLIKGSVVIKGIVLLISFCTLVFLVFLTERYIFKPIANQQRKLDELRNAAHQHLDQVAADIK